MPAWGCRCIRWRSGRRRGSPLPWGTISQQTVTFANGVSQAVGFSAPYVPSATDPMIGGYDVIITWNVGSCQNQSGQTMGGTTTSVTLHRLYNLFAQPIAPMQIPWVKVLELGSTMTRGLAVGAAMDQLIVCVRGTTGVRFYRLRAIQAAGVSSASLWMEISARPGRTSAR